MPWHSVEGLIEQRTDPHIFNRFNTKKAVFRVVGNRFFVETC